MMRGQLVAFALFIPLAQLSGAQLSGAELSSAQLSSAQLGDAQSAQTGQGTVSMQVRHERAPPSHSLAKRDDSSKVYGSFTIAFELGTPGQNLEALLDTGSSDLWVNSPETKRKNTYQPDNSSTYAFNSSDFNIFYGAGEAHGDWVSDTISIAGAKVDDQIFGIVNDPTAGMPVFGIGLMGNEATNDTYINVPENLKVHGHIHHNAYSMYLDNLKAATGRVLFGGVDTAKYKGDLLTVPLAHKDSFMIESTAIKVDGKDMGTSSFNVLVDSGTTFTYLPEDMVKKIADKFSAKFDDSTQLYYLSERKDDQPDFEFNFRGAKIVVPSSEMVIEAEKVIVGQFPGDYILGVIPTSEEPYILGDTFLRSAYMVFDLEKKEVSMAQSSYSGETDIKVINGSIPGAKPAPDA